MEAGGVLSNTMRILKIGRILIFALGISVYNKQKFCELSKLGKKNHFLRFFLRNTFLHRVLHQKLLFFCHFLRFGDWG